MSVDEKLDWLRARIEDLQRLSQDSASASGASRAIASLNAKIEHVAKQLEELKERIGSDQ